MCQPSLVADPFKSGYDGAATAKPSQSLPLESDGESEMRMKSAVESQFLFTATYAALLVAYADHDHDLLGLGRWIDSTIGAVDSLLFFLPQPQALTLVEAIYRHVLVVGIILTAGWLWLCRNDFASWARDIIEKYSALNHGDTPSQKYLREAHGITTLGAVGTAYLLLFDGVQITSGWLPEKLTVFRAPLLTTTAFFLICHALALRKLFTETTD
jgi:hypothetical protein